jgi:predicted nucleic acid-binding protein
VGILIDSTVFIEYERKRLDLAAWLGASEEAVFVSVITALELWHGYFMAASAEQASRRRAWIEGILERFPALDVTPATAMKAAELRAELQKQGLVIGAHDLLIAATARVHQLAVATANLRDFNRVAGLSVQHWTGTPSK